MFEITMDAGDQAVGVAPGSCDVPGEEAPEDDEEAISVCRRYTGLLGIFLDRGLEWQHFRGRDYVQRPGDLRPRPPPPRST